MSVPSLSRLSVGEAGLKLKLFGHFEAWRDGVPIPPQAWSRSKTLTLLKILLSERGQVFTQDKLIEYLFPDLEVEKAAQNLRRRVSELRHALEPELTDGSESRFILLIGQGNYCFSKEALCWLDTEEFQELVEAAQASEQAGRWPEALETYQRAIQLYQGEYLAEDLYEDWSTEPREHWRQLHITALARLAECHARLGQYQQAIQQCARVIELQPTNESIYRQKMLYHSLIGERSSALEVYQACAKILKERLDAEPGRETCALHEQILQNKVPSEGYPPPRGPARHNLPEELTSFVGQEEAITQISQLLKEHRLFTLTGVGGCGKTRLALQVAANIVEDYADGVWLVELASLSDASLVPRAVAEISGIREQPGRSIIDGLMEYLRHKAILLVIDNCEHLIEACAQLIHQLLRTCSGLKVLATSRETLGLAGEMIWQVLPLSLPNPGAMPRLPELARYDAIQLFLARAANNKPGFQLTEQNALAVVQICQRLDGLPLAIELAAARLKSLSVRQIAQRLEDCFRLLTGGARTALPQHQTLKATIDWSYDLLSAKEQALFRKVSAFAGGWTLEAAEAICVNENIGIAEVLDLLTRLCDKSLVFVQEHYAEVRYHLLETVRQYGAEKLGESGEVAELRERHRDFFLNLAERARSELEGPYQLIWLEKLKAEENNLRTALQWSMKHRGSAEEGLRLAGALSDYWYKLDYYREGRGWLEHALATGSERTAARAKALQGAGFLSFLDDPAKALSFHKESIAICRELGDKQGIANSLLGLGLVAYRQADYAPARTLLEQSLALWQESKNKSGTCFSLFALGVTAVAQGDYTAAHSFLKESLSIARASGDKWRTATALAQLGGLAIWDGSYAEARPLLEQSLVLFRELGNNPYMTEPLTFLGVLSVIQGDYATARLNFEDTLAIARELDARDIIAEIITNMGHLARSQGDYERASELFKEGLAQSRDQWSIGGTRNYLANIRECLEGLVGVACSHGRAERAVRLLGAVEALREESPAVMPWAAILLADTKQQVAFASAQLGKKAFAAAYAQGQAMTLEQAIAFALEKDSSV